MTLIALWYRKDHNDIYAVADSRLVSKSGTLTDKAPKFTVARVVCYAADAKGHYELKVLDKQIAVGYAGSSSVAFATITTLQSYLSSLVLAKNGKTPTLGQISDLAKRILEQNFRDFGTLWQNDAKCDLVFFGYLPLDNHLKCFRVSSDVVDGQIYCESKEFPLVENELCISFGSCSDFFMSKLKENMERTGNFHPFNLLNTLIASGERSDIGGYVQVAIANKSEVILPHVSYQRLDRGKYDADVTFLGRDVSEIGPVGDCLVGKNAIGPDLVTLLEDRKKAGY